MNDLQKCTGCGISKPLDEYSFDKRATTGRQSKCRQCYRVERKAARKENNEEEKKKRREYYAKNRERILASNARSKARNRESVLQGKRDYYRRVKDTDEYKKKVKAYQSKTKKSKSDYDKKYRERKGRDHLNALSRAWAQMNKEKRKAISQNYKAKRREAEMGGATSAEVASWIIDQEKICFWCGEDCVGNYHVDHFEPLSGGGAHCLTNMVIACPECNIRKNCIDPFKFAERRSVEILSTAPLASQYVSIKRIANQQRNIYTITEK